MVQVLDESGKIKAKVPRPAHVSGLENEKKIEINVISKF